MEFRVDLDAVGMGLVIIMDYDAWVVILESPRMLDEARTGNYQFVP